MIRFLPIHNHPMIRDSLRAFVNTGLHAHSSFILDRMFWSTGVVGVVLSGVISLIGFFHPRPFANLLTFEAWFALETNLLSPLSEIAK